MGFVEPLFFWIFATGALVTSLAVVVVRNPLYCALALIADFFFFAGLYVLLSAHFLAVVQVLVYGGAIMVLFLFIIMLLNLKDSELGESRFQINHVLAVAVALALFFSAGGAILAITSGGVEVESAALAATLEEGEEASVAVMSDIPGLYLVLDERTLEAEYRAKLVRWEEGRELPSDNKYVRFDTTQGFVLPASINPSPEVVVPGRKGLYGTFQPISVKLVNRFVVPFELTAILLLAAIVGAVIIAKRRVAG